MDIESLRCFVAAAEYCNFSSTAEHLYLTQSAVSRKIAKLEDDLGIKLFERSHSKVSLTSYGKALLEEAKSTLYHNDQFIAKSTELKRGGKGTLKVLCNCPCNSDVIARSIADILGKYDDVKISMSWCDPCFTEADLRNGNAHVLLSVCPDFCDMHDIDKGIVKKQKMVVSFNICHDLVRKDRIVFDDLKDEHIFIWEYRKSPNFYNKIAEACVSHNFKYPLNPVAGSLEDVFSPIISNEGVIIHTSGLNTSYYGSVKTVPIADLDIDADYYAAWLPNDSNPLRELFLQRLASNMSGENT